MDVQAVSVEQPHPAMADAVRLYGPSPYRVVLVHGGPGGAGEMSPLARTLGGSLSLVEAMQTKLSIADLIDELREQIAVHAQGPAVLVGHSWGAWLCLLFTARHPEFVERIVLISSGVLEDPYAATLRATQLARLSDTERAEMATLEAMLADPEVTDKGALFDDYGYLFEKGDMHLTEHASRLTLAERDRPALAPAVIEAGVSALHDCSPWLENGESWITTVCSVHEAMCRVRCAEALDR
jgi:pimeloyl-ACP methyl ester carboxylesterase